LSEGAVSPLPVAVERALGGNAAERALYAYALGLSQTRITAGTAVAERILPYLEQDPYSAVRLIATRAQKANEDAKTTQPTAARAPNRHLLPLSEIQLSKLWQARDTSPIVISE
jgi:hypothetical protein